MSEPRSGYLATLTSTAGPAFCAAASGAHATKPASQQIVRMANILVRGDLSPARLRARRLRSWYPDRRKAAKRFCRSRRPPPLYNPGAAAGAERFGTPGKDSDG